MTQFYNKLYSNQGINYCKLTRASIPLVAQKRQTIFINRKLEFIEIQQINWLKLENLREINSKIKPTNTKGLHDSG